MEHRKPTIGSAKFCELIERQIFKWLYNAGYTVEEADDLGDDLRDSIEAAVESYQDMMR